MAERLQRQRGQVMAFVVGMPRSSGITEWMVRSSVGS